MDSKQSQLFKRKKFLINRDLQLALLLRSVISILIWLWLDWHFPGASRCCSTTPSLCQTLTATV